METLLQFRGRDNPSWFEDSMQWHVHDLCSELILWMFDQNARPGTTSLVGILSSLAFERLLSPFVSKGIVMHLRPFVELTALLYSSGGQSSYAKRQPSDVWLLHACLGSKVLQYLDKALNTTSLEKSSLEQLHATFLVLFATIIGVGYSRTWNLTVLGSPLVPNDYVTTQAQLLRVLAHHLIFIGRRTELLGLDLSESQIIKEASCQWKRRATFEWEEIPCITSETTDVNAASHRGGREITEEPLQCRYHISRSHTASADCRPVGGFGTCIKDVDFDVFGHELSPMDYILAEHQLSATGAWPEGLSIDGLDLDFSNDERSIYEDSSNTESTILTPQSTREGTPQSHARFGGENSRVYEKDQPDGSGFPEVPTEPHSMRKDHHCRNAAAAATSTPSLHPRSDTLQRSDTSMTPEACAVPPLSQGYEDLGGLAARLRSTNLVF